MRSPPSQGANQDSGAVPLALGIEQRPKPASSRGAFKPSTAAPGRRLPLSATQSAPAALLPEPLCRIDVHS
ncbi:hypothetical protein B0T14DRAFT_517545 [Immersiella caudata]|uniref:Uncharacterized protein n=1 Tax=Immersiella caudata TaxID=314043 RepID=A0AA39WZC0_9PEZI|nr:hypothetical protein B0T14DRAFT_517545 [Immersiella caudata]